MVTSQGTQQLHIPIRHQRHAPAPTAEHQLAADSAVRTMCCGYGDHKERWFMMNIEMVRMIRFNETSIVRIFHTFQTPISFGGFATAPGG